MLFIKKLFVIILTIVLASCAENNKNIPISGADVTSESNIEVDSNTSDDNDSQISVSDNIDARDKTKQEVLTEELIEVGDRVFFDYDKSRFKNEGVETLKDKQGFIKK